MRLLRSEAPPQERVTGTPLGDALALSINKMVMVNLRMMETIMAREPAMSTKAAFLKLKLQELKAFSGKPKDNPWWRHDWAQRV